MYMDTYSPPSPLPPCRHLLSRRPPRVPAIDRGRCSARVCRHTGPGSLRAARRVRPPSGGTQARVEAGARVDYNKASFRWSWTASDTACVAV